VSLPHWRCEVKACRGSAVVGGRCVAHLREGQLEALERSLARTGILEAADTQISGDYLSHLLRHAQASDDRDGVAVLILDGATIEGNLSIDVSLQRFATFEGATFTGDVELGLDASCPVAFDGARFDERAEIYGEFRHMTSFSGTRFGGPATIRPQVDDRAIFLDAQFGHGADFSNARFGALMIERCRVDGNLILAGVWTGTAARDAEERERQLEDWTWWREIAAVTRDFVPVLKKHQDTLLRSNKLARGARIRRLELDHRVDLRWAHLGGQQCAFVDVRFNERVETDRGVLEADHVLIQGCRFAEPVAISIAAKAVDLTATTFVAGVEADVSAETLRVERCRFERPSRISAWTPDRAILRTAARPRLLSLRRTYADGLRLSHLDLAACRFAEVHPLDRVGIEGPVLLAKPPPPRFAARRGVIADEWDWRAREHGWTIPASAVQPPKAAWDVDSDEPPAYGTAAIAGLYRALRKGTEESKDEPGAADFYYGEMEMRRRSAAGGERLLLWLYWLVSGYGLRASRALAALAATIVLFAFLFWSFGFRPDQSFGRGLLFSLESGSSLFRQPEMSGFALTAGGEALQLALRLLGALLLGLLLLALRSRVKR
jgi:hypothetical protein